jgi:hypothetical protein
MYHVHSLNYANKFVTLRVYTLQLYLLARCAREMGDVSYENNNEKVLRWMDIYKHERK